jgi:hypothetical protein
VSEVIEEFIRRNPDLPESAAFDGFLQQERIQRWVGADPMRRERLRAEFVRVWRSMHPSSDGRTPVVVVREPAPAPSPSPAPAQKLDLMCAECNRLDVWRQAGVLSCRSCGRVYDDMLQLVPVKPVGPFEFMFGEGAAGWLAAAGIALLLLALYGVLRWL